MTKKLSPLALTAFHPYLPGQKTSLSIEVVATPPGKIIPLAKILLNVPSRYAAPGKFWCAIWGPYALDPERWQAANADAMLSLLWDLRGEPMRPGGPNRPPANHVIVRTDETRYTIYRSANECSVNRTSHLNDRFDAGAPNNSAYLPDRRSKSDSIRKMNISEEIAERTARFENPKYEHRIFVSYKSLCEAYSQSFDYLSDLPRQEFFEIVEEILKSKLIDLQDPEGAAVISILRNRLKDHIESRESFLNSLGRPVNGYQPGRHC